MVSTLDMLSGRLQQAFWEQTLIIRGNSTLCFLTLCWLYARYPKTDDPPPLNSRVLRVMEKSDSEHGKSNHGNTLRQYTDLTNKMMRGVKRGFWARGSHKVRLQKWVGLINDVGNEEWKHESEKLRPHRAVLWAGKQQLHLLDPAVCLHEERRRGWGVDHSENTRVGMEQLMKIFKQGSEWLDSLNYGKIWAGDRDWICNTLGIKGIPPRMCALRNVLNILASNFLNKLSPQDYAIEYCFASSWLKLKITYFT